MASFKPEVFISRLVENIRTKCQRLNSCFRGRAREYCTALPEVRNPRWWNPNRITLSKTVRCMGMSKFKMAAIHRKLEMTKRKCQLRGRATRRTRLLRRLPDVWICKQSLFPIYFRLTAVQSNILRPRTDISQLVSPCCLTSKTWVSKFEFVLIMFYKRFLAPEDVKMNSLEDIRKRFRKAASKTNGRLLLLVF